MNPNPKPMPAEIAAKGRAARTEKKAAAVRQNGKLGGRKPSTNPSPAALAKRLQRAKKKLGRCS